MKLINNVVKQLLTNQPELQDSDMKLIAKIWSLEMKRQGLPIEFIEKMKYVMSAGYLTSPESIMRSRRKVQEDNTHLRGRTYAKRQAAQKQFKKQLTQNQQNLF